uniref:Pentacotripeptide-repeat region of PRORP domain-containing protein n=1 Tax=Rhodosorus marinus TaxID=101924 RepID=A0A7S3A8X5_9RHOD|mmetsp:Transcript_6321/g.26944  ORF Transcript_6321/g.26944 Transcript_6321/m.26944 type:complete len:300 (+) Transcript_6321:436-1335(+)
MAGRRALQSKISELVRTGDIEGVAGFVKHCRSDGMQEEEIDQLAAEVSVEAFLRSSRGPTLMSYLQRFSGSPKSQNYVFKESIKFLRRGRSFEAIDTVAEIMKMKNVPKDQEAFHLLIKNELENERHETAISLYEEMAKRNFTPTETTVKCLLNTMRHGNPRLLERQYLSLLRRGNITPSDKLVELFFTRLCRHTNGDFFNIIREHYFARQTTTEKMDGVFFDVFSRRGSYPIVRVQLMKKRAVRRRLQNANLGLINAAMFRASPWLGSSRSSHHRQKKRSPAPSRVLHPSNPVLCGLL